MSKIEQWYQTAYGLQAAGDLAAAEPLYRRILVQQPRHFESLFLLGSLCVQQGRHAEALPLLERVLALKPRLPQALNNRAVSLKELGRTEEALVDFEKAIEYQPDYPDALNNRGLVFQSLGRIEAAIESFQQALRLRPGYPDALNNLGIAYNILDRLDDAEAAFRDALTAQPDYSEATNNLGMVRLARGCFADALCLFEEAIAAKPTFPQAHNNRGAALKELGRYAESEASYRQALALKPDYVEAHGNFGTCLVAAGRLDDALAAFDAALALDPNHVNAHWNRALCLLLAGDYAAGWHEYECRFRTGLVPAHASPKPLWNGSPLHGRTILVHAEQGFGDTLHFVRYLPLVQAQGGRVLFECQPPLLGLLHNLPGADRVLPPPAKGTDHVEHYDVHFPLLSLPSLFGTTVETIPADASYLHAPADVAQTWRTRIEEITRSLPSRLKVGLVWAGNPTHKNDHNRSCSLEAFAPLAQIPGVLFYSLQKGPAAEQAADAPAGMTLIDLAPALADFADTAAVIEQLDLVIAVDTSVVHLAGALGKPTWVLVPDAPDWRWLMDREDTPWYPTVRLFRQSHPKQWEPVIGRITAELALFAARPALQATSAQGSPTADALAQRGEAAFKAGDAAAALHFFEEALALDPAHGRSLSNLAVLAFGVGAHDEAIHFLSRTLQSEPANIHALENMARCCEAKGENAQALGWWQKALAVAPTRPALWNALGQCCVRQQVWEVAVEALAQSLRLCPGQNDITTLLREAEAKVSEARPRLRFGT